MKKENVEGDAMAAKKPQVKCPGCGLRFYREDEPHIHIKNRYWHTECYNREEKARKQSEQAIKDLENYICKLFGTDHVSPRIRKQIATMISQYNFTHSGILGSLKYWFEVKNGSIEKSNGGIGIVPYIYEDARKYYESISLAHQVNKEIKSIDTEEIIVRIPSPKRNVKRLKLIDLDYLEEGEVSVNDEK